MVLGALLGVFMSFLSFMLKFVSCIFPLLKIFQHLPGSDQMIICSRGYCEYCIFQTGSCGSLPQNVLFFDSSFCHNIQWQNHCSMTSASIPTQSTAKCSIVTMMIWRRWEGYQW